MLKERPPIPQITNNHDGAKCSFAEPDYLSLTPANQRTEEPDAYEEIQKEQSQEKGRYLELIIEQN
jgi:hypothetical protein